MRTEYGYETVHSVEEVTLQHEKNIGMADDARCLPAWIRSLSEVFENGTGKEMSKDAVRSLLHTLIACRKRQFRLISERDDLAKQLNAINGQGRQCDNRTLEICCGCNATSTSFAGVDEEH
jgi:hypothetical protein